MFKLFLTGDNHFGKKYDRYPEARDKLIESRFQSFENMVRTAEKEGCGLFVVTGDLFDNIATIRVSDVKRVAGILSGFAGTVLVLPGNHDYYTGDEKVWSDFTRALEDTDHNIILLNEYRPYELEIGDDNVRIWPAFCPSKHGKENNLDWIRKADVPADDAVNIGIAHGALRGITPDQKEEYFLMTEEELLKLPMQVWLLGHTHIPYPQLTGEDTEGFKIFNPGTHEQTDLHNRTDGYGFILTIKDGGRQVLAHSVQTGNVRFHDLPLNVSPEGEHALQDGLRELLSPYDRNAVVRVRITGCVQTSEYEQRQKIYAQEFAGFLSYECLDAELSEEITAARIRDEYPEFSFAARFIEEFLEDPVELRMAYELLKECKDTEGGGRQ